MGKGGQEGSVKCVSLVVMELVSTTLDYHQRGALESWYIVHSYGMSAVLCLCIKVTMPCF